MQKTRTPEQILADLDAQFPKTNFVEEGKQTMARKTKAAAPEKVQEDPSRVRRILQKHQNKKLTPKEFGTMMTEAFGQQVQYQLAKSITAITDLHVKDVQPQHITFDFRGGWGKAVNIRAFIPQKHTGEGVQIRISMDVVNGVWDAKTALQYDLPVAYDGSPIEQPVAGSGKPREDAPTIKTGMEESLRPSDVLPADNTNSKKIQQSGISGMRMPNGLADIGEVNEFETERAGIVYRNVTVRTGWLAPGDTGVILNADGVTICPAEIKNIVDDKGVVTQLGAGNTAAVEFDYVVDEMPLHAGCTFVVRERAVKEGEKKPFSLADLGRRAQRPIHSRNPTPPGRDGHAVVVGAHPHPSGTQYGVRVKEGTLRIADVLQVWRDGRYHTGAHLVAINREGGEAIQIALMGEQAGVFLNIQGITDLKSGDEIYVVDRAPVDFKSDLVSTLNSDIVFTSDVRGKIATIKLDGMTPPVVLEKVKAALLGLPISVSEITNAQYAVQELLNMVSSSNLGKEAATLVLKVLHQDEFYPVALQASVMLAESHGELGVGTIHILDGMGRRQNYFGIGGVGIELPQSTLVYHGLVAYFMLSNWLALDDRDRADFEHAYLETHRLGAAEGVRVIHSTDTVMEIWVEKSKFHPSGYKVAALDFGKKGIERFQFFPAEEPERATRTETGVKITQREGGFTIHGPLRANFANALAKLISTDFGFLGACLVDSFKEVQRVATEALVDNPDHWKDDEIVPWEAEFRGLRDGATHQAVVLIRNMKDGHPASGFCLKISATRGHIRTSLVYGFGRYTDLKLVKGVEMWADLGISLIADHLIDAKTDYRDVSFVQAFTESVIQPGDKIILLEKAERNAYVIVLTERMGQKVPNTPQSVLGELNLVNGRITSWEGARKGRPVKVQPQPHRHHHMDAEHNATSIVPRPRPNGDIYNLHQVQAMIFLRQLLGEDTEKLGTLQDFVEGVVANARDGGTEHALLFSLTCLDSEIGVFAQYLDTAGQVRNIAKAVVYL